jgi:lysophospholipase L1-like esterase
MDLRIGFFGDSFVNGFGDPDGLGWVGRVGAAAIARGHTVTSYNAGIRGDTSADVRDRWRDEAARRLPAEHRRGLVFAFGVNDCLSVAGRPALLREAIVANAREILAAASGFAPTLLIGPPPIADDAVNARLRDLIAAFDALGRELAVPFLDVFDPLRSSSAWQREIAAGDGAHPGCGGYQALAGLVDGWAAWRAWLP